MHIVVRVRTINLLRMAGPCCAAFFMLNPAYSNMKGANSILTHEPHGGMTPAEMKAFIEQSLDADKAEDIVTIKLDDQGGLADYMVIASGTSSRHVSALADKLMYRLSMKGVKGVKAEGMGQSDWVAIDAGDIIVHLFRPEVRSFYNLEKMWGAFQPFEVVGNHVTA